MIILSIFLTLEVKSYLILINFRKIVRILMISEKSDLGTHSVYVDFPFRKINVEINVEINLTSYGEIK